MSAKRKLDDHDEHCFTLFNFEDVITPPGNKMSKPEPEPVPDYRYGIFTTPGAALSSRSRESQMVRFFVKTITEGKTVVVHAYRDDTVAVIQERIFRVTKIQVDEQRLLYRGKQLQREQSLEDCGIERDSTVELISRMRSTPYPYAWQVIDEMVRAILQLYKGNIPLVLVPSHGKMIRELMKSYLKTIPGQSGCTGATRTYFDILITTSAPQALVMLYASGDEGNRMISVDCVKELLDACVNHCVVPSFLRELCVPIVFKFCELLRASNQAESSIYKACRYTLGVLLDGVVFWSGSKSLDTGKEVIGVSEIFSFINELKSELCKDLKGSMQLLTVSKPCAEDVRDFTAFLVPVKRAIMDKVDYEPISYPVDANRYENSGLFSEEIGYLFLMFTDMLGVMTDCLVKMEAILTARGDGLAEHVYSGWSQYLLILKELFNISMLYKGGDHLFWRTVQLRRNAVRALVLRYVKRTDNHFWLLGHNDVTDFESRRHLVMMMLPDITEESDEVHEMLIDRSKLLEESFSYIAKAEPESLRAGLFMEFKNEEATGPGVLREWFLKVFQALFNQENALFVACQGDPRRFYPNPASKMDPLHLEYFYFTGRMIALALMHKVQVGILFSRSFFLQLAGERVSLEDIQDADPQFYSSCKRMLIMNADFIDSDALALTFVSETVELGSRKVEELCKGGTRKVVNSNNIKEYVNLLIQHRFVKSVTAQVTHFKKGFDDMVCDDKFEDSFFRNLELEDVDWLLYGSEDTIQVEDWKAHTDYNGYNPTDPQILWFWEIVEEMSLEQKKTLLFFWTSVKYLPYGGFHGLASRLDISKVLSSSNHLPSSHTCFYQLCLPAYPTTDVMRARLNFITQEHVGSTFGTY